MPGSQEYKEPWPFDLVIAGQGVMLEFGNPQSPPWSEQRANFFAQSVALSNEDRSYAQYPPEVELPYAVSDFSGGAGLAEQRKEQRDRYWYTLNADASSGMVLNGPLIHNQTALGAAGTQAVDFNGNIYLAAGRYLYKRSDDTAGGWILVKDFGVGAVIGEMAAFQGTQSAAFLFIPLGSGVVYQVMSTAEAFTPHGSQQAEAFETVGNELWLANTESSMRVIRKCEDGGTAASWQASTTIGDPTAPITWLRTVNNRLLVVKANGLFGPTTEAFIVDEELAPELRQLADTANGKGAIAWNGTLVFSFGGGLWRYDPETGLLAQFGPELLEAAQGAEVMGQVAAQAGQAGMCLWAVVNNPQNGHAYLWRYGAWRTVESSQNGVQRQFLPVWHGALAKFSAKVASACHVTSVVASKPRLYVFFTDGTVAWCKLPRTANPLDDPSYYEFDNSGSATGIGQLYLPRYNAGFFLEDKVLRAVGVNGRNLSANRILTPQWRAPGGSYASVGNATSDPGSRLDIGSPPSGKAFDLLVQLTNDVATTSPVLQAVVTFAALRTANLREFAATLKLGNGVKDRRGMRVRTTWHDLKAAVQAAITANGSVTIITPGEETLQVVGEHFASMLVGYEERTHAKRWTQTIRMIQQAGS